MVAMVSNSAFNAALLWHSSHDTRPNVAALQVHPSPLHLEGWLEALVVARRMLACRCCKAMPWISEALIA